MRAVIVIVEEEVRKIGSAMVAGLVGASVGPFASDGLDEPFGFTVCLRPVWASEAVFDAELATGGGEVFGTVGGAAIGQDALDLDVVKSVEVDGLVEGVEDAWDFLVWEDAGKGEAGMIIDSDVEAFDACAGVAHGAIARGANAWHREAAEFFDVQMEEFAWVVTFVADDGRARLQSRETVEAVPAEDPGDGGLGNRDHGEDLGVGATLAAQGDDVRFDFGFSSARLSVRDGRVVMEL